MGIHETLRSFLLSIVLWSVWTSSKTNKLKFKECGRGKIADGIYVYFGKCPKADDKSLVQTCVNGRCKCFGSKYVDRETCLAQVHGCNIVKCRHNCSSADAPVVGCYVTRSSQSSGTLGRSCDDVYVCRVKDNSNLNYEVHVLASYRTRSENAFYKHPVVVQITQVNKTSRPVVIVLLSQKSAVWNVRGISEKMDNWRVVLITRRGVTQSISGVPPSNLLKWHISAELKPGYGVGSNTVKLIKYVVTKFGPITTFTGRYKANYWKVRAGEFHVHNAPSENRQTVFSNAPWAIPLVALFAIVVTVPFVLKCIRHIRIKRAQRRRLEARRRNNLVSSVANNSVGRGHDHSRPPPDYSVSTNNHRSATMNESNTSRHPPDPPSYDDVIKDLPPPTYEQAVGSLRT